MKLRGTDFGSVLGASGVEGFFGEGYRFHRFWRPFGLDFAGMTFVAKTTTLYPNAGNLRLDRDFSPRELFPGCVVVKPVRGMVLNAVGLSGPGFSGLLDRGLWQARTEPFFLSLASVAADATERMREYLRFAALLKAHLRDFRAPVGLQINFSCPNAGAGANGIDEIWDALDIFSELGIPLMPKFSLLLDTETAVRVSEHKACDALCVSNTIPWGELPEILDWKGMFGSNASPLAHLGGGGLSGKPLLPLVADWVREAKRAGITKPINAGGGVNSEKDARYLLSCGADSVFLGSVAILRPWRVRGIIRSLTQIQAGV